MFERGRYLGTAIEHEGFDNMEFRVMLPLVRTVEAIRHAEVEALGELPKTGPALLVPNHPPGRLGVFHAPWGIDKLVRRMPQMVVKRSLVDTEFRESAKVVTETGKQGDIFARDELSDTPGDQEIFSRAQQVAKRNVQKLSSRVVKNTVNATAINRERLSEEFFSEAASVFEQQRLLLMFLQMTRSSQDDLRDAKAGAALVAARHPDVPVYPMGVVNVDNRTHVTLGKPFVPRELAPQASRVRPSMIQEKIVNEVANILLTRLPSVKR